jgi:hypothetical protein
MRAFYALGFVSRLPIPQSWSANRRKSPATSANIPVLRRLSAETRFDLHCVGDRAVLSLAQSETVSRAFGPVLGFILVLTTVLAAAGVSATSLFLLAKGVGRFLG